MNEIAKNIADIKAKIGDAKLVAVSKYHPVEKIKLALDAGHRLFGENRVQEAVDKWTLLKMEYPDIKLHLIGGLQTNKVKEAVQLFDVIETVDRKKLAVAIRKELDKCDSATATKEFYIQVNIGEEEQKNGIAPSDADEFIRYCKADLGLNITGVMCIPPADEPPHLYFGLLHTIARRNALPNVSMGMSSDYHTAVKLGSTHVRVGTAIFGER